MGGFMVRQDLNAVFVNYQQVFSYDADYHLNLPENFIGTSGNQVGIYGGLFPAKEGGVPGQSSYQLQEYWCYG
jgi:hypothetical protein